MDYGRVLKRAWNVTWRYRILWLFGLFVGGMSSGGGSSYQMSPQDMERFDPATFDSGFEQLQQYIWVLVLGVAVAVVIGLALWIISVAARGGLIHLVNEAEEGRPVRAADGWSVGFRNWGRIFAIDLVLYLPLMLVMLLVFGLAFAPLFFAYVNGGDPTAGILSMCGGTVLALLVVTVLGFVVGLLELIATRHAVLGFQPAMHSISLAWTDLRTRFKDLFVMWLLTLAVGLAYGFAVGIVAAIFGVGMGLSVAASLWFVGGFLAFIMFLVLLIPGAIFGTFSSALWTVFYRQMTGMDAGEPKLAPQQPVQPAFDPAPGYTPASAPAYPAPGEPPAPPAASPAPSELPPPPPSGVS